VLLCVCARARDTAGIPLCDYLSHSPCLSLPLTRSLHSHPRAPTTEALFQPFMLQNFGTIQFTASADDLQVTLQVRDQHGSLVREVIVSLDELQRTRLASLAESPLRVDTCPAPALWQRIDHDQARVLALLSTALFVAVFVFGFRAAVARCCGRVPSSKLE
jgi:hypothetical protein